MTEVVWTAHALKDLEKISDYITTSNVQSAVKLIEEIEMKVGRLEAAPESGRKVPEFSDALHVYREVIVKNYRIIYRFSGEKVYILTVRHGRRNLVGIPFS